MTGKKELTAAIAQKDQQLEQLRASLEELTARVAQRDTQLAELRARESAVISALTEAELAAANKLKAADYKCDKLLVEAEESKNKTLREAERVLEEAQKEAQRIVEEARGEAEQLRSDALIQLRARHDKLDRLKDLLETTAQSAEEQIRSLAGFVRGLNGDVSEKAALEFQGEELDSPDPVPARPEPAPEQSYDDPAEFIKNLYSVEGRNLSGENEPDEAALDAQLGALLNQPDPESKVWTVDEILGGAQDEAPAGVDDELNALIEDVLR